MEGSARLKRFLFAFGFWLLVPGRIFRMPQGKRDKKVEERKGEFSMG